MKEPSGWTKANGTQQHFLIVSQSAEETARNIGQDHKGELKLLYLALKVYKGLSPILKEEFISCVAVRWGRIVFLYGGTILDRSYQQLGFLKKYASPWTL